MSNDPSVYYSETEASSPRPSAPRPSDPRRNYWVWNRIAGALLLWPLAIFLTVHLFIGAYFLFTAYPDLDEGIEDATDMVGTFIDVFAMDRLAAGWFALLALLEAVALTSILLQRSASTRFRLNGTALCLLRIAGLGTVVWYIATFQPDDAKTDLPALLTLLLASIVLLDASLTPMLLGRRLQRPTLWLVALSPGPLVGLMSIPAVATALLVYGRALEPWTTLPWIPLLLLPWAIRRGRRWSPEPQETSPNSLP